VTRLARGRDTLRGMPTPWPLVGRAAELADVADAMDLGAGGVLFAGPAGVGKTRLATECLALAEDRKWSTAVVRANRAAASIPYGAFAPLLPAAFRSNEGEADALRQAAHAVLDEAGEDRLLILIDDAHELDDASAALVHLLASSPKVFLVVTVRTGADAPEPVPALWKDELLERIEVPNLDADAAAELVSRALGGPVDGLSAYALWTASGGNALFLRELVIGACDAGALRDVGGGLWRLTGTLSPSTRLGEVVGLRLGALSDDEREVVELVAVGEPVSLDDLVDLVRTRSIDELERRGLIEVQLESQRRQVRMAHPLYGEVVRAGLPERRRQEVFGQLADALEARGAQRREDVLRVAVWRLDAGGGGRPELLVAAARQAHAAHDISLGVRLSEAALAEGAGDDAAHVLGVGLDDLGEHERAEEVLRAGEENATDARWRARMSLARADNLFRGLGRADDAKEIVRNAELRVVDDPMLRNGLVALRATFLLFEGRLTDAIRLVEPLLGEGTDVAYAQGALAGSVAMALGGRANDAVTVANRGEQARVALGETVQLAAAGIYLVARAQALLEVGQMREAAELAQLGYDGAVEIGAPHGQAWFATILGRIDLHRGKAASAALWSREGGVVWRELRHPAARWGFGALATAQALAGDLDDAEATYAELDAEPPTPVRVFDPEIDRGRASIAAQRGERTRACEILVDAADRAEAGGAFGIAAGAIHDLARLGEVRLAVSRLDAIEPNVDGDYMAARHEHARALLADDADRLDTVSEAFERIGALLLASEAASSAAAEHRHAAMRRKATASAQRAAALLAECEGARPFGVEPEVPGVSLTRREREVAELAANNLTSREIAEKLFVSTRTVENHLQRAYEKLGVRGRRELREALAPGGEGA
jgi:ATP/maltotriose-dependent transcriptional regulator MalT